MSSIYCIYYNKLHGKLKKTQQTDCYIKMARVEATNLSGVPMIERFRRCRFHVIGLVNVAEVIQFIGLTCSLWTSKRYALCSSVK